MSNSFSGMSVNSSIGSLRRKRKGQSHSPFGYIRALYHREVRLSDVIECVGASKTAQTMRYLKCKHYDLYKQQVGLSGRGTVKDPIGKQLGLGHLSNKNIHLIGHVFGMCASHLSKSGSCDQLWNCKITQAEVDYILACYGLNACRYRMQRAFSEREKTPLSASGSSRDRAPPKKSMSAPGGSVTNPRSGVYSTGSGQRDVMKLCDFGFRWAEDKPFYKGIMLQPDKWILSQQKLEQMIGPPTNLVMLGKRPSFTC